MDRSIVSESDLDEDEEPSGRRRRGVGVGGGGGGRIVRHKQQSQQPRRTNTDKNNNNNSGGGYTEEAVWDSKGVLHAREDLRHESRVALQALQKAVAQRTRERDTVVNHRKRLEDENQALKAEVARKIGIRQRKEENDRRNEEVLEDITQQLARIRLYEEHEMGYMRPMLEHLLIRNKTDNEKIFKAMENANRTHRDWDKEISTANMADKNSQDYHDEVRRSTLLLLLLLL